MNNLLNIYHVFLYGVRRLLSDSRIFIVGIITILYLLMIGDALHQYILIAGEPITPWLFPFIMANRNCVLVLFLLLVLLFCDAPYIEENAYLLFLRCGRTVWMFSQLLYTIIISISYVLFVVIITIVMNLFDCVALQDWGRVFYTLANTNAAELVDLPIQISKALILHFSPKNAMVFSITLSCLAAIFLGSIVFLLNLAFSKLIGSIVGSMFVLFQFLSSNASGYTMTYFSPISWVNLDSLDFLGISCMPSIQYAFAFFCLSILIFWLCSFMIIRNKDIIIS